MKRFLLLSGAAISLVILSAFVYGYEYGATPNHIQVIPFIEKIKDPSLFPGDYFVDTLKRFPSVYPYMMAVLSMRVDLELLHLILYAICKFAVLIAAWVLARFLFKSEKTALVTMFLFALSPLINAYGLLGHDPLIKTSFYQTSIAAPLAIFAILSFLEKRYLVTSVLLAAIYYINGLVGNFLLVLFLVSGMRLRPLLLFALLMIPGAIWLARLNIAGPLTASRDFVLYLKLWYTGHYFPSHFTPYQWYHFVLIMAFFLIFFQKGFAGCREKEKIRLFLFTLAAMWIVAYIFADIFPVRSIILLQFLRSDTLFIALGVIFAANYIRSLFESKSLKGFALGGMVILALIEFSKPSYKEFVLMILILTAYEAPIKKAFGRITAYPERAFGLLWAASCIALIVFSGISFFACNASPKMLSMFIFSIALAAAPALKLPPRSVFIAAVLVCVIAVTSYAHIIEYRISSRNFSNLFDEKDRDWKELQLWARENTAKYSMFIAPLEMNGFRVFSNRPVFTDWVDGSAMHWTPGFEEAWVDRLKELGVAEILIRKDAPSLCGMGTGERKLIHRYIYSGLTEDDFKRIGKEYRAAYVIEEAQRPLSFEMVHRNKTFCVYKIR